MEHVFYLFCFHLFLTFVNSEIVILRSNGSTIVGRKLHTTLDKKPYGAFWKIPYAVPPLKELRFKPPRSNEKWQDDFTYDFSRPYNNTCFSGSTEDCLYLSVFMPLSGDRKTSFPILVWVHELSNLHGPDFFVDENVIVVTLSYRTSMIGFLNTRDEFSQGNMGAKDVLMALKWIRENIMTFNGDINKVTVAGAANAANVVAALLLSPASEDLFNRVIIQSGSALTPADYRGDNEDALRKLYSKLKGPLEKYDREHLYELLRHVPHRKIKRIAENFIDSTEVRDKQRLINAFGPSIESAKKYAFMNKHPMEIYKRQMANNNVDVLIGYTSLEAMHRLKGFISNRDLLKHLHYNFQYLLPFEGDSDEFGSKRYRQITKKIMEFYFANGTITERSLRRYAKYNSDQVVYPLLRQARLQTAASCANVYLYRFTFKGSLNTVWESLGNLNYSGASSGDEICYLFRCKSVNEYRSAETTNERQFIKKIARLWANFAKCGNPTPESEDKILGDLSWTPLSQDGEMKALNLGRKIKMVKAPEEKRMKFWDELRNEYFPERLSSFRDEL